MSLLDGGTVEERRREGVLETVSEEDCERQRRAKRGTDKLMSARMTVAPSEAKRSEVSRPMPEPAPSGRASER